MIHNMALALPGRGALLSTIPAVSERPRSGGAAAEERCCGQQRSQH
jgi:hypothetical protein